MTHSDGYPILFRTTRNNRHCISALIASLDTFFFERLIVPFFITSPEDLMHFTQIKIPLLFFYSFMTPEQEVVEKELRQLKNSYPGAFIFVAGGCHASGVPEDTLHMGFDHVVVGAGELIIQEIIFLWLNNRLNASRTIWRNTCQKLITMYPPFSVFYPRFAPIEITRGCPWNCAYCQTPTFTGSTMAYRPISLIEAGLSLAVHHGRQSARFVSTNAFAYGSSDGRTSEPEAVRDLLRASLRTGMQYVHFGFFPAEVRPETVTPEMLEIVKTYCKNRMISLGIQSGSERILKLIHRGHTVEQGLEAVRIIRAHNFSATVDLILGFPMETEDDRMATLELARQLVSIEGVLAHLHWFMPLPDTPLAQTQPTPLDAPTKSYIDSLIQTGNVFGWWKEQAAMHVDEGE